MWSGILKLLTFEGLGVWYMVDLVLLMVDALPDADDGRFAGYFEAETCWGGSNEHKNKNTRQDHSTI